MRNASALVFLALAACSGPPPLSPEARCFAEATAEYRTQWRVARTARADLERGYGIQVQTIPVATATTCYDDKIRTDCLVNTPRRITTRYGIDEGLIRARIARAEARMDALRPAAMAAAAPCGYGSWSEAWRAENPS